MADGNLVRQSNVGEGAMVFGPSVYDVPLLPYERELIKTIGITEKEYQLFAAEVRRRGRLRPAEYEHIPDIVCLPDGGLTILLINLAIGLVLTGAAYLLTPKPKMPSAPKSGRVDLDSITGASRFTPSRGFDTLNELADYSSPIPIIFGLYNEKRKVGGMLVEPRLVWSRMFSHGTQQQAKLLFVVGEQGLRNVSPKSGIAKPDLEGIFLGNNALDVIYEELFAFYWKQEYNPKENDNGLIYGKRDLIAGTRLKDGASGDPDAGLNDEVFVCPSDTMDNDPEAFCHAYSPVNNIQFGVYGAIANGTGYRLNYRVITVPRGKGVQKKAQRVDIIRRLKVIGDLNLGRDGEGDVKPGTFPSDSHSYLHEVQDQHHEGEGRQYSPRMGIFKHIRPVPNSDSIVTTTDGDELTKVVNVKVGDKVVFRISHSEIPEDVYKGKKNKDGDEVGEKVDDINSTVLSDQLAADAAMQKGEIFAIGNTLWKVIKRDIEFNPELTKKKDQQIFLECIETKDSILKRIGIVSLDKVIRPEVYIDDIDGVGPGFFPLTHIATATIRNNRPAVVTELGIKSSVYQNLQGLCSFPGLPSSKEIKEYGKDNVVVSTGTITATIARSSSFRVFIRKAGVDKDNEKFDFKPLVSKRTDSEVFFTVVGRRPVAQYNFIRIKNPQNLKPQELEFKIVPMPAAEMHSVGDTVEFIKLAATRSDSEAETSLVEEEVKVDGINGTFKVVAAGSLVQRSTIRANKEFTRKPNFSFQPSTFGPPTAVEKIALIPVRQDGPDNQIASLELKENVSNLPDAVAGRNGAMTFEMAGNPDDSDVGSNQTTTIITKEFFNADGTDFVILRWTLLKRKLPDSHFARKNGSPKQKHVWAPQGVEVLLSSRSYAVGDRIKVKRGEGGTDVPGGDPNPYSSSNNFRKNKSTNPATVLRWSGQVYKVTSTESLATIPGRTAGFFYELFGSAGHYARDLEVGTTRTVGATYTNDDGNSIRIQYKSEVKDLPDDHWSGESVSWEQPSFKILQGNSTTSDWDVNDTFTAELAITNNNPFKTVYDSAGFRFKITQLEKLSETGTVDAEVVFEGQSQFNDISFYRSLVKKSNENEPEHEVVYVNEILPNDQAPVFNDLTMAGLSLKASRNFTQLDQVRTWVGKGICVERLHHDLSTYEDNESSEGPSNLLTDLVFHLFTNQISGVGGLMGMNAANPDLVDKEKLIATSRFLEKQELFFNGVIGENVNLRQFITDMAPNFLCNFILADGKFALVPAVPSKTNGSINTGAVEIKQLFTSGNILEDSFKLEYLRAEERRPFKATVRYRQESRNKFPEEKVVEVRIKNNAFANKLKDLDIGSLPHEQFNLTQFCTSKGHAVKVAKYFLGLRELVTHTISFSTTVHGLNLEAGAFIKVITESSPYSSANNGTIGTNGQVTSVTHLDDGDYDVSFFKTDSEEVQDGRMTVSNGIVTESKFHDSVFTLVNSSVSENVYVVEQLTFSQEGTVDIVASEHPCNDDGSSKLAHLVESGTFNVVPADD